MFRVTYKDMWEALYRVRVARGFRAYRNTLRQLLTICAFDNRGVLIPDEYRVKR